MAFTRAVTPSATRSADSIRSSSQHASRQHTTALLALVSWLGSHQAFKQGNQDRRADNVFDVGKTKGIQDRVPVRDIHEHCMWLYSARVLSHDIGCCQRNDLRDDTDTCMIFSGDWTCLVGLYY